MFRIQSILIISLILLSACSEGRLSPMRVATIVWPGYEPLYLAREKGYLDDDKVHLVEFSASTQSLRAFRNELVDAAALTLDETLQLLDTGEKISVVLVMDISNGADVIIARSGIESVKSLKGKRIGVENTAVGGYVMARALALSDLKLSQLTVVPVHIDEHFTAFMQGRVDAVVTFDPVRSKLIKAGGKVIFDSTRIPGEIVDVLVVRTSYLESNKKAVQHLIDAWYKSLLFMKQQPGEAAYIIGQRMKLDNEEVLESYKVLTLPEREENNKMIDVAEPGLLSTARSLSAVMHAQGLLEQNVNPESLFTGYTK